jgi:hypothetical protein
MNLNSRLTALERCHPRQVLGYQITRQSPAGEVLQTVVRAAGRTYESVESFFTAHPNGQIPGGVILTDDGREPAHNSLMAQWFKREAAS